MQGVFDTPSAPKYKSPNLNQKNCILSCSAPAIIRKPRLKCRFYKLFISIVSRFTSANYSNTQQGNRGSGGIGKHTSAVSASLVKAECINCTDLCWNNNIIKHTKSPLSVLLNRSRNFISRFFNFYFQNIHIIIVFKSHIFFG